MSQRDQPPGVGRPLRVPGWDKATAPAPGSRAGAGLVGAVPGAQRAPAMPRVYAVPPPWEVRPLGASDFQRAGTQAAVDAASSPLVLPGSAFTVPAANVAWIRSVTFLVNGLLTTSDIVFRVRENGVPIEGWDEVAVLPRSAGSVALSFPPEETYVKILESRRIDVQAEVRDGGTYQLSAQYHGWFYPLDTEAEFR